MNAPQNCSAFQALANIVRKAHTLKEVEGEVRTFVGQLPATCEACGQSLATRFGPILSALSLGVNCEAVPSEFADFILEIEAAFELSCPSVQ